MNVTIHRTWNMDIYVLTLNYDRLFGPLPAVFDQCLPEVTTNYFPS